MIKQVAIPALTGPGTMGAGLKTFITCNTNCKVEWDFQLLTKAD